MTTIPFIGAVEVGLVYAFVAVAIFVSFRVIQVPDLTVEGSFPLGAAVAAVSISAGWNPWLATGLACLCGGAAGLITAIASARFRILPLFASIFVMFALVSASLRIMTAAEGPVFDGDTVFGLFHGYGLEPQFARPFVLLAFAGIAVVILTLFLKTDLGLAMRAAGCNPRMAGVQGVRVATQLAVGLALSNALAAFGGALYFQIGGAPDQPSTVGIFAVGLAALIIGEAMIPQRGIFLAVGACVFGALIYALTAGLVLRTELLPLTAWDLKLATALFVLAALTRPRFRLQRTAT